MVLISLHNNLHRLSQSNNFFVGSNDFFLVKDIPYVPPMAVHYPHSPQRWSNYYVAYQGKDIVFGFIIEYSSLRNFAPR
jgi:hypothetical protein